ncbi:ATP-binding protein [Leptolyngbya sp. FACHB-36]|uniref:ATP-binding protein n=1 Tax=Leptolyngbya sp. FACHB-36 TaxID=2692808 RepID=UPI0016803C5D|nr:ATP-binding protein [Leptolyngbya sp. FACHB-36]MBD2019290.1 ATP-binding protein [Leptolyngbya sp. FACHB-36]
MRSIATPPAPQPQATLLAHLGVAPATSIGTTSSSPFTGSPSFDAAPFHVNAGKQPRLGTFVLIGSEEPTMAHYGRIVEGLEENPRAEPSRLQKDQAYQAVPRTPRPSELAPHVTRVMNIEILGQLRLKDDQKDDQVDIRDPEVLPQTGMAVYELPTSALPDILKTPKPNEDGLSIGHIETGGHKLQFCLPMDVLPRHMAVLGKTGVGKSHFCGVMVEEITRYRIPIIAIDILGDLVPATESLKGANLRAGQDFKVPYSIIGRKEFLDFVPTLTDQHIDLVSDAYDVIYTEAIESLKETGTVNIPIERLYAEIRLVAGENGQEPVGGRAIKRVKAAFERSLLLVESLGAWVEDLITKPIVNIFVGHLAQGNRNLVVGAAARVLQVLRQKEKLPPFLFVLDEAHFFLPGGGESTPTTQVMRQLIRTGRHDAVGVVLITQSPASMDKQTLTVCNTRVVFALDPDDLKVVSGTMGDLPQPVIDRIPKMARGRAIIASAQDILRHPVLVNVRDRSTPSGAPTPKMKEAVQQWRQNH